MLEIRQQQSPQEWTTFNTQSALGQTVLKQGRLTEAEPLLLAGYQGLETHRDQIPTSARDTRLSEALDRLIELYTLLEKPEEVAKFRELRQAYPPASPPAPKQ
jgi:hypothetical protein